MIIIENENQIIDNEEVKLASSEIDENKEDLKYQWFIVTCPTGAEHIAINKTTEYLTKYQKEHYVGEFFIPYNKKNSFARARGNMINYLFLNMVLDDIVLKAFKESKVISLLLDHNNEAKVFSEEEINVMRDKVNKEIETINSEFKIGEEVLVNQEPFNDFKGIIDEIGIAKRKA